MITTTIIIVITLFEISPNYAYLRVCLNSLFIMNNNGTLNECIFRTLLQLNQISLFRFAPRLLIY